MAEQLKLAGIYKNSMDAVSDRDFVVEFLANASLIMIIFLAERRNDHLVAATNLILSNWMMRILLAAA